MLRKAYNLKQNIPCSCWAQDKDEAPVQGPQLPGEMSKISKLFDDPDKLNLVRGQGNHANLMLCHQSAVNHEPMTSCQVWLSVSRILPMCAPVAR